MVEVPGTGLLQSPQCYFYNNMALILLCIKPSYGFSMNVDTKMVFHLSFEGMTVDSLQQNSYITLPMEAIRPHCKKKVEHFSELGPGPFDIGGSKLTYFPLEYYRLFYSYLLQSRYWQLALVKSYFLLTLILRKITQLAVVNNSTYFIWC